jgi:hypothetical protein
VSASYEAYVEAEKRKLQQQGKQPMKQELVRSTAAAPPALIQELEAELARYRKAAEENSTTAFSRIFRFVKGEWVTADQEKERIPDKTRWLAVMSEVQHGWCKWETVRFGDNGSTKKLPRYVIGPVTEFTAPSRNTLGDLDEKQWEIGLSGEPDDPWKKVGILALLRLADETPMTFITDTKTGVPRFWDFIKRFGKEGRKHPWQWPIVENRASSYQDKRFGRVPIPEFDIVDWVGRPGQPIAQPQQGGGPGEPPPCASDDLHDEIPF